MRKKQFAVFLEYHHICNTSHVCIAVFSTQKKAKEFMVRYHATIKDDADFVSIEIKATYHFTSVDEALETYKQGWLL